jgi:hypothetical protein
LTIRALAAHIDDMNRKDVEVSTALLEEALKITGEDSPAAVVDKALSELVRIAQLKRGIQAMKDTSDVFWPNYLEELRPNSEAAYEKRKASYEGREVATGGRRTDCPMPLEVFEDAAQIFRLCRDDGYVIASAYGCLIAACAIRNSVPLLQRDRDFEKIADVAPLELLRNVE